MEKPAKAKPKKPTLEQMRKQVAKTAKKMTTKERDALMQKRGKSSRRKGQRGQLEVNRFLNRLGIPSEVVARAGFKGEDLRITGASGKIYTCEVKNYGKDRHFPNCHTILEGTDKREACDVAIYKRSYGELTLHGEFLTWLDILAPAVSRRTKK